MRDATLSVREHELALLRGPALHLALQRHGLDVTAERRKQFGGGLHPARFARLRSFDAVGLVRERSLHMEASTFPVDIT
jgi:hypothetical protein